MKLYNEYFAGCAGGVMGTFLSHPFDTIRILMQSKDKPSFLSSVRSLDGIRGFYRGITPPLLGIGLEKSIVFGTFHNLEKYQNENKSPLLNGMIAGFLSTLIVTPIEKIKIALQTKTPIQYSNMFRGWTATIFRETPGYAIYFKTYYMLHQENETKTRTFINGCLSGISAWTFIYPSDLIKTRIQCHSNSSYKDVIQHIFKSEGIRGFYTGFPLALMRCVPLHGGVFMGYELYKEHLMVE
jgi:solute carrier family 25 carnitine/acylcarnitine transporter 20/29